MQVSALMTELKGNAMRKRIGATAAALCVLLMVGCAPAVQAPIPTDNDATAGVRAGGAGPSTDNNTGSDINSVLSDEVTTEDGDAPQPTEGVTDNRDTAPPTDVVTTDQGDATPPPPLPQTNLDIYWVGPLVLQSHLGEVAAGPVVALSSSVLVAAAPLGSAEDVVWVGCFGPDQVDQQSPDFRDAQGDEVTSGWISAPFFDRVTVRNAWASIDRVMCRYQPVYCRT